MKKTTCSIAILFLIFSCRIASAQDEKKNPKADTTKKEADKKLKLPLKAERKIPIKTSERSWMSLDISPDGKTIAFDFLGDIFTMVNKKFPGRLTCVLRYNHFVQ